MKAAAGSIPGDDPRWRECILNESSAKQGQRTTSATSKDVRQHGNINKRNKLFWLKSPPREEGRQLERRKLTITRSIANLKNASNRKVRTFSPIIFEEKDGGDI